MFYATGSDGVYVNQFVASTATLKLSSGNVVSLKQATEYPVDGTIRIQLGPQKPETFAVRVRLPGWCAQPAVMVNGILVGGLKPGTYAEIKREWKSGDQVEVALPMVAHWVEGEHHNSGLACLIRGPVVYMVDGLWVDGGLPNLRSMEAVAVDIASTPKAEPLPAGCLGPAFTVPADGGRPRAACEVGSFCQRRPLVSHGCREDRTHGPELYSVWLPTLSGERYRQAITDEIGRHDELSRVVDRAGPSFKDQDHHPQNGKEQPQTWSYLGLRTRHSGDWFSWDLRVLPDAPMTLRVGCWGGEFIDQHFAFDVLVDGQKVGEMTVPAPEGRVDGLFTLPVGLTQGKEKITARFQAHRGKRQAVFSTVLRSSRCLHRRVLSASRIPPSRKYSTRTKSGLPGPIH